jgi:hypothetical protein
MKTNKASILEIRNGNCCSAASTLALRRKGNPDFPGITAERMSKIRILTLIGIGMVFTSPAKGAEPELKLTPTQPPTGQADVFVSQQTGIWQGAVGNGFRSGVWTISLETGGAIGLADFGSQQAHDLELTSLSWGRMWGGVKGKDHWYRGNWEVRGELFGGAQFSPENDWLVGLTPHLRYNFATGTRWIPFIDAGSGVMATSIGLPDLSGTLQFCNAAKYSVSVGAER